MDRAKQLFFNHYGIKHWMWHDGDLDEYNTYCISEEQESAWYVELQLECRYELENGGDAKTIFPKLEAIATETNNDVYIEKALKILKCKNK